MAGSGTQFAMDVKAFVAKSKLAPELVVRKVVTDLLRSVVTGTPVGNPALWASKPPAGYVGGRLRAGWNVSIASPDYTLPVAPDAGGEATIARGLAVIAEPIADNAVYIINALPYVRPIEYEGHSRQAPAGMVRISVARAQEFIDKAVAEVVQQ